MQELVVSTENDCIEHSCILFDFSGRLLYHDIFWDIDHSELPGAHLLEYSPDIAEELIKSQILVRHDCYDPAKKIIKHSHVVNPLKFGRNPEEKYHYDGFYIKRLIGTNLVLVVAEKFDIFSALCEKDISEEQHNSLVELLIQQCESKTYPIVFLLWYCIEQKNKLASR